PAPQRSRRRVLPEVHRTRRAGRARPSDLHLGGDRAGDPLDGVRDRDAVLLAAVTEPEAHGTGRAILLTGNELVGHLGLGVRADLLRHPVARMIDLCTNPGGLELRDDPVEIRAVL